MYYVQVGSREGALAALAGLTGGGARLPALPLWTCVRAAGARPLQMRLSAAFRSARAVHAVVANAGLRVLVCILTRKFDAGPFICSRVFRIEKAILGSPEFGMLRKSVRST